MLLVALEELAMLIFDELLELLLLVSNILDDLLEIGIQIHLDFLSVVLSICYFLPDCLLLLL
jgi:hypothetical protein